MKTKHEQLSLFDQSAYEVIKNNKSLYDLIAYRKALASERVIGKTCQECFDYNMNKQRCIYHDMNIKTDMVCKDYRSFFSELKPLEKSWKK